MKILVNTPDTAFHGGVASHFRGLKPFWKNEVVYNFVGGRKGIPGPIFLVYDFFKFILLCFFGKYDVILLNPSLGKTALIRDGLFLNIAKMFKVKTVVFFHGWSNDVINQLDMNSKKFIKTFNKAEKIIVLAQSFKLDLLRWGITKPVHLSTTKVSDEFLTGFDFNKKEWNQNVLFLTRIEKYKGIFITLEAFKIVKEKLPFATLTIAGNGTQLLKSKEFVKENKIKDVRFLGNISGTELTDAFSNASVYILPSHSEGMPTSVLEAMAIGLPIISRPVGGLVDFFQEDKMGYLIDSLDHHEYAEKIQFLLEDLEKCKEIGKYNHEYAKKKFMASKVALEIENILNI